MDVCVFWDIKKYKQKKDKQIIWLWLCGGVDQAEQMV